MITNTVEFVTYGLWTAFGLFVVLYLLAVMRTRGFFGALRGLISLRWPFLALIVILLISTVRTSAVFVEPQQVGVVISALSPDGYQNRPMRSGLRWVVPLVEHVELYPISFQTYTMSANPSEGEKKGDDSIKARTSDGQEVSLDCSLIFQIDPDQAVRIHIDWQDRYIDDFVRPVTRGVVRTQVSQYKADEVNSSRRLDLERDINKQIRDTFEEKGFTVDRFVLRNISFSPEYALSIEQKQVALQGVTESEHKAQQTRNLAEGEADAIKTKAQAEADAAVIKATADSQALKLIADALSKDKNLLTYTYIQKLSPAIRAMLVPNNAPYFLPALDTLSNATPAPNESAPIETTTPTPPASPTAPKATPTPTRTSIGKLATSPTGNVTPTATGR